MPVPSNTTTIAFLGCGVITGVHSRQLRGAAEIRRCYASRDGVRAEQFRQRYGGFRAHHGYAAALADPDVDAVVVAVPPALHLKLTVAALEAGKHVLVEKPAFPRAQDYRIAAQTRDRAGRVVLVGENDHYKPLAVALRRLLADGVIGDLVMVQLVSVADRPKRGDDWRNEEDLAGGDAFFEEGIHWLHLAGSLGPRIVEIRGFRPEPGPPARSGDRRRRSMLVAFGYDTGAVGALFYSREIPSLLRGARISKLYGREGVITFESNGAVVLSRGRRGHRVSVPGVRDVRGYRAMYDDFVGAIHGGPPPQMSLERALADHELMERARAA